MQIDWWETDDPLAREECGLRLEIQKQTSLDVEVMPMRASRGNRPENKIDGGSQYFFWKIPATFKGTSSPLPTWR